MKERKNREDDLFDKIKAQKHVSLSTALDDEQRIRVLSPTMLIFKRFIRNSLAITGFIFIASMFLFSFVGGWLSPYGESQLFTKYEDRSKDYAGVTRNDEYKFITTDGSEFPTVTRSQFVLAINTGKETMTARDVMYSIEKIGKDFYFISNLVEVANMISIIDKNSIAVDKTKNIPDNFADDFWSAVQNNADSIVMEGVTYTIIIAKKGAKAYITKPFAIATMSIFDFAERKFDTGYEFRYQAELALNRLIEGGDGKIDFTADEKEFEMEYADELAVIYLEGQVYANISKYNVQAIYGDVFLSIGFKTQVREYIYGGVREFTYQDEDGKETDYTIIRNNEQWTIKWIENTLLIDEYSYPSKAHPLGTDGFGMDLLTRLMYGGRISLMIGFIVVVIEVVIGVILGGLAGYFGKWIDNLLMRIVDIFNCIPFLPLIIIIGAIMDQLRIDPQVRMIYLMIVLGIFGWPGIARLVRGQILSLREQEFMIATEATGLSVRRRIYVHLIPNVIPQLIVFSTMSLGSVILTESVLSFLGLGVKFPFASWGNIINAVSNVYVMTNYWFVWIPAGFCILITVLGFNFVGDGLRDAFDPKMKR